MIAAWVVGWYGALFLAMRDMRYSGKGIYDGMGIGRHWEILCGGRTLVYEYGEFTSFDND